MKPLAIRNLHPAFGVEVEGLDPSGPLDEESCRALRQLFDERGLLLFRDLDIDLASQNRLSQMLIGGSTASADAPSIPDDVPEFYVSNRKKGGGAPFGRLLYHSDMMWLADPCRLLSLYGATVEEPSVPTLFVSTTHAWDTLPADLRARVQDRRAIHGPDATHHRGRAGGDADVLVSTFESEDTLELPVGHRHPRTGRTMLFVCQQMTEAIVGLSPEESEELLEALFRHLYAPENVLTHHWCKGDLVLWDNLALQHARPNVEQEGPARSLRKVFAPPPRIDRSRAPRQSVRAG